MRLLLKILLSLIISVAVLLMLESFVKMGLEQNRNLKLPFIRSQKIDAKIVANGACEIEMMLDPSIIKKYIGVDIYNLALNHSDFADNYLMLKEYLSHQQKPDMVLMFAIPEGFDSGITNTFNTYRYAPYLSDADVINTIREVDPNYAKFSFIPFLKYSYYSNQVFTKSLFGWRDFFTGRKLKSTTGYVPPWAPWHQSSFVKGKEDKTLLHFQWSPVRVKYFVKTLQLLKSNNIKVLAYYSPIYHEAISLQVNRNQILQKIDSVCREFGVPYLQFDSLPMRFQRENYYVSINPTIPTYNNTIAGNLVFNNYFGKFLQDSLPSIFSRDGKLKSTKNLSNTDTINKQK